jgi:hypothetical protein
MTEAEWLSRWTIVADRQRLANELAGWVSRRKVRLFACACCRRLWDQLTDESRTLLLLGEKHADKKANPSALPTSRGELTFFDDFLSAVRMAAYRHDSLEVMINAVTAARSARAKASEEKGLDRAYRHEAAAQIELLRDIFGNPFHPVSFSPEWRTGTAVALAKQMYDSRDFGAMPILADALQDAGCDDEQILSHCRGPGPHARGCWVVDLVLGRA